MENKTLHEVCEELKISRRAVQGYEKAGLVVATDRNKYGHLLYDEKAQKRMERIKLYQQFGFTIKEIQELIDAPKDAVRAALEKQVLHLKEEKTRTDALIEEANKLIADL